MNALLDPPTTVLLVASGDGFGEGVRSSLRAGEAAELRTADSVEEATDVVADDESVACVVTAGSLPDGSGPDLCRAVRRIDEDLPVVVSGDDRDGDLLRESLDAGVTDVVPETADGGRLRSVVDDAITAYQRRRVTRENGEMLEGMLASLGKSVYFKDEDGRFVHHADVGGGPDPADARGKTDPELYGDAENARRAYEDDLHVLAGNKVVDREERIGAEDLWMRTTKVPLRNDDGDVAGLVGHTVEVTEYKRTERRLERLRDRFTSFTGQLRHDVKTQLQVAHGRLDAVTRGDGDAADLGRTLDRIDRIVEDYDDIAKRSFDFGDDRTATDLGALAADLRDAVGAGDADVVVDVAPGTYVNAPTSLVRTVLRNLLRDAVATVDDGDAVRVGTTEDGFYVEDSGDGLPEFKRSVVETDGYTTTRDGNGRELRIAKDQMDYHVWSLSIGEGRDDGTRVAVENSLADVEGDPAEATESDPSLDSRTTVGNIDCEPVAAYDEGANRWRLTADGNDVFRQDNDFFFVNVAVEGDVSVRAKLHGLEHVADRSKAGVMVRDSLAADATYGYVGKTPAFGTELLWRSEPGADGQSRQFREHPSLFHWYRIDRVGDELRALVSIDGQRWQTIGRRRFAGDDPVHVGLVVCSTVPGEPCEAAFEDVVVRRLDGNSVGD